MTFDHHWVFFSSTQVRRISLINPWRGCPQGKGGCNETEIKTYTSIFYTFSIFTHCIFHLFAAGVVMAPTSNLVFFGGGTIRVTGPPWNLRRQFQVLEQVSYSKILWCAPRHPLVVLHTSSPQEGRNQTATAAQLLYVFACLKFAIFSNLLILFLWPPIEDRGSVCAKVQDCVNAAFVSQNPTQR